MSALKDKTSSANALKLEALVTLHQVLRGNPPELFPATFKELSAAVFAAARERYYKVGDTQGQEGTWGGGMGRLEPTGCAVFLARVASALACSWGQVCLLS
jgi:hypothetical protein